MIVFFIMSKAFTKETDNDDEPEKPDIAPSTAVNYVTPNGLTLLQNEYRQLLFNERPKLVETIRWAAGNGDRSENGDYIYGKKRLREIDRRVRYLTKQLDKAKVVDPKLQKNLTHVFFGATVTYKHKDHSTHTVNIVGLDEADLSQNKISWTSPVAKALLKTTMGDTVTIITPAGRETVTIINIEYKA